MTRKNIQVAPSPRQLLNGQGVRRISGFKSECHGINFGTLNVRSLCGRKTEVCEELRKRKVDVLHSGSKMERPRSSFCGYFGTKVQTVVVRK